MSISVFLSYPQPYMKCQVEFINEIKNYLNNRGLEPKTIGVTDYNMSAPLTSIRTLMYESNGLLTIAFRRSHIQKGASRPDSDIGQKRTNLSNQWLTSPYCHIEPAMAFQMGLPILILREKGVIEDGILQKGVTGLYLPEFDLNNPISNYFTSLEWNQLIEEWVVNVRKVRECRACPPKLY